MVKTRSVPNAAASAVCAPTAAACEAHVAAPRPPSLMAWAAGAGTGGSGGVASGSPSRYSVDLAYHRSPPLWFAGTY